ncbi:MAG: delta-aminolevulinic acid dehydratase [Proteobacteria bacterium]|nr:delta-aminolevulinic acid dehydratase [Pseudomonadota bacterium]
MFLTTFLSANLQAECECLWEGSFTDVQAATSLVVSATVVSGKGNSKDLQINQLLRGKETFPTIRVWLKAGDYCRPEASLFPTGTRWVMALNRIENEVPGGFNPNTPNVSYGRVGDYVLSSCGGYWLSNSEGWVTGNLVKAPRWVREPKMTPVLLDLVAAFVAGDATVDALVKASKVDPALRELMQDTKAFLRE